MPSTQPEKPFTLNQAADLIGCSRRWLQYWLQDHPGYGYKIGREWRFTHDDVLGIRGALRWL